MVETRGPYRSQLIDCVRRLAASADVQVNFLKKHGYPVDELALDLNDWVVIASQKVELGEISAAEARCVTALDSALQAFSGSQNAHLWNVDALANAEVWAGIRTMASDCLRTFDGS
jgi:hypothetical protein